MQELDKNNLQDRIAVICNDLYTKGTKPSVRLVLSMLPDVSSTSTVHKYFANWKKELEANQQSLYDRLGFSSEFTQSFMKEITRFGVEAEQRYKELATDSKDQRDIAIEELEKTEEKLFKQNAIIEQQAKQIKELQNDLVKSQEKLKSDLSAEKQSNTLIVSELRQQLASSTDETRILTATNETLRTEIAKAQLKLESNQEYVGEVKTQNIELVKDNKELNGTITELSKNIASHESTIKGNDKLISNLESSATSNKSLISKIESDLIEYKATNTNLTKIKDDYSIEITNYQTKLSEATSKIQSLDITNKEQSSVIKKLTING